MRRIPCPHCGLRVELEFRYGGEADRQRVPDAARTDEAAWAEFLYARRNPTGAHRERWMHRHGCGRFFIVTRETTTGRILAAEALPRRGTREAPGAAS